MPTTSWQADARAGIARAVFVGTSMGGLITMTLAGRHLELHRRRGAQRHRPRDVRKKAWRASPATRASAPRLQAGTKPRPPCDINQCAFPGQ
jgi:pimeloyl-ACP methyl ester carboxylesterase